MLKYKLLSMVRLLGSSRIKGIMVKMTYTPFVLSLGSRFNLDC